MQKVVGPSPISRFPVTRLQSGFSRIGAMVATPHQRLLRDGFALGSQNRARGSRASGISSDAAASPAAGSTKHRISASFDYARPVAIDHPALDKLPDRTVVVHRGRYPSSTA